MSKFYTYSSWEETFKPIKNKISKYPDDSLIHFETYGEEYEAVKQANEINPKTVWTEVDGEEGSYIVAGWHYVNRIHYYITENPWEDEWTEVPTWCERMCDCQEAEDFDWQNPTYCDECSEREGYITIPIDTVEDLKAIYGEDAPIVK
jgi:hypothetical protein